MRVHFIILMFVIWRVNLEFWRWVGESYLTTREGFLGPVGWANFDGVHYLSIAEKGYFQFEQAFFPLYPLLIKWTAVLLGNNYLLAGLLISHISFLVALVLLSYILRKHKFSERVILWTITFLLLFPTAFYFISVYTESMFFLLILLGFYALMINNKWLYVVSSSLASATRLVGAFLLVPVGLLVYMWYLLRTTGDPLFFVHAQPAFGANRTGGEIILLPQVLWRYFKIFTSVPIYNYDLWIAVLELVALVLVVFLLWVAWHRDLPKNWVLFSVFSVLIPTMSGTLSSMPRYILTAFPIYIVLALYRKLPKLLIASVFYILQAMLVILFTRGYWVS